MKDSNRMEPLIKAAERIKSDQTLPREMARKLLAINRSFQREVRKCFQALEILKGSKRFLGKVKSGKMTMKEYETKMSRASQRIKQTELLAQTLSKMVEKTDGSNNPCRMSKKARGYRSSQDLIQAAREARRI